MFNKKGNLKRKKLFASHPDKKEKFHFFFFLFLLKEVGLIHLSPIDRIILLISKNSEVKTDCVKILERSTLVQKLKITFGLHISEVRMCVS